MTPPDLSRGSFEAWLRGKEPGEVVGRASVSDTADRCSTCPLASWLGNTWQWSGAHVIDDDGEPYVTDARGRVSFPLPQWAVQFMARADATTTTETAADCLVLLSQIPEAA